MKYKEIEDKIRQIVDYFLYICKVYYNQPKVHKMNKKIKFIVIISYVALIASSCNVMKYVPEGQELLKKTKIKTDVPDITTDILSDYLYQTPNNYFLGLWRMQLGFYSASGNDSTKWINRWLRRIGEPPVIYDSLKTEYSAEELQKVMFNKGYLSAEVSTNVKHKKRQVSVLYTIKGNTPYRIRNYDINIPDSTASAIIKERYLKSTDMNGVLFDIDILNEERSNITKILRNNGYYNFNKELLYFAVDSTLGSHQIDCEVNLQQKYLKNDSALKIIFTKKNIDKVTIYMIKDASLQVSQNNMEFDTIYKDGFEIITKRGEKTFKPSAIIKKVYIMPNTIYNERRVDRTYSRLNSVSAIKYVNIAFIENSNGNLNARIIVSQDKPHSISAQAEVTYSDGDFGVKLGVGYKNNNIFRGGETLSLDAKGGWEGIGSLNNLQHAWDYGADVSLKFPTLLVPSTKNFRRRSIGNTDISVSMNFQQRPEYNRNIANAGFKYNWRYNRVNFTYNLIDISYIYLPRVSDAFKDKYLSPTSSIRFSYEDNFIMRMGFGINYSNRRNNSQDSYFTLRANIRTAGNLLYAISNMIGQKKNADNAYEIFHIRYSQYAKADIDYSYNLAASEKTRLVFHAGLGIGYPYGNGTILPFEERYFSGGANSMRGWSARTLGPGNFHNSSGSIDFMKQSGDIKLDLNFEARFKLFWKLQVAIFLDGGNIWTIKDYPEQPTGFFRFDTFYKQIAVNYGAGIRLDFDFFVIRVDLGIKLYDPGYPIESERFRTELTWANDFALHFAVGYPF